MGDVAKKAEVSLNTVSLTVREPHRVSHKTREKVEDAIRELNYIPNRMAGYLASNKTNIIGVVIPTLKSSIYSEFIEGISEVLNLAGYQPLIGNSQYSLQTETSIIESFLSYRPAGLILVGHSHTDRVRQLLLDSDIPIVETISIPETPLDCSVGVSQTRMMYSLTDCLINKGYSKFAYVHSTWSESDRRNERLSGFLAALSDRNCEMTHLLEWEYSYEMGASGLDLIRKERPDTEVVIFSSDPLAVSALLRSQQLGLRVPQDVAIAGIDNSELGGLIEPGLTSMEVNYHKIGCDSAEVILGRISGKVGAKEWQINLGFKLVERGSA